MDVRYYVTDANRCPAGDFLAGLPDRFRGQIRADLTLLGREGERAPISKKTVKGHKPMWELRIGGYRVFFFRAGDVFWVLGGCKKQDQNREILASAQRMKLLRQGG
jgi:putative component of toxin-antitoxin plasmid stabilization module